jgi:hypothetical protein
VDLKHIVMNVLMIGGTGFLGSHIVDKLIDRDHRVTVISRNPDRKMIFDNSKVNFVKGDILTLKELTITEKFDVIVYTAMIPFKPGRISAKKFRQLQLLTRTYFENTVNLAKKLSCPLVLTSGASFETVGNEIADEHWPLARKGMAALGKCYDEIVADIKKNNSIPLIEMLPGQIYGNGGMFLKMINMAQKGRVVILGNGKNYLPRIHVDDCASAYVLAIEKLPIGKRFIVCDNENVSVKDFMLYLAEKFKVKKVITIPKLILRLVIGKHVYNTLTMNSKVTNSFIKNELLWQPFFPSYKEGIDALAEV